jgi:arginyl-tRNA synthetase
MVTFEELLDEVGTDATRYLMLARSTDQAVDFDIEAAKKQDASNPVYYVQYAHARICSLVRKAPRPLCESADLSLLVDPSEIALAKKISEFTGLVSAAARDYAPSRLTHYAESLAAMFHSFYTCCQVISDDEALTDARLYLAETTRGVLELVLSLLGVSAPERM